MKRTILSVLIGLTFSGLALAQTKPQPLSTSSMPAANASLGGTRNDKSSAAQQSVQTQVTTQVTTQSNPQGTSQPAMSSGLLTPAASVTNPFTGTTAKQEDTAKILGDLQAQSLVSRQKLNLQKDELEAIRIESEKRKIINQMNAPVESKEGMAKTITPKARPVKKIKEKPQVSIIGPQSSKNERPEVVGVLQEGRQRVALVSYDGKSLRAQNGSFIAGKEVTEVSQSGVKWGGEYLSVSSKRGIPTIERTDFESPAANKKPMGSQLAMQPQMSGIPPQMMAPQRQQTPVLNPTGANIASTGASGPTGVFNMLPPPPPR